MQWMQGHIWGERRLTGCGMEEYKWRKYMQISSVVRSGKKIVTFFWSYIIQKELCHQWKSLIIINSVTRLFICLTCSDVEKQEYVSHLCGEGQFCGRQMKMNSHIWKISTAQAVQIHIYVISLSLHVTNPPKKWLFTEPVLPNRSTKHHPNDN